MEKEIQNSGQEKRLLRKILEKWKKMEDSTFLNIMAYHLKIYRKYRVLIDKEEQAPFPNKLEYQKFQVAKLAIDKISLLDASVDPAFIGFKGYKDMRSPPIEAFSMTSDMKEARKIKFCLNINKGDVLDLKVVEEYETEYKLLVINKYNDNERVVDYVIYAYMVKSHQLNVLKRPLETSDLVRAAVLGKCKREGNTFNKLLVTFNRNMTSKKYKDVLLGRFSAPDIPYYAEDISQFKSFFDYMKADKSHDDPQETVRCMTSLGIDPYKIYTFYECDDGKKLGKPKEIDLSALKHKSMDLIKKAEKQLVQGADCKSVLALLEEALVIFPKNDSAYAVRGQLFKQLYFSKDDISDLSKALDDFGKSLKINPYNLIATREYLSILMLSLEMFEQEENTAKADQIKAFILKCKGTYDVTQLLCPVEEEEKEV